MVNKYISFLKKSIIFLLIALIIVSYSFGMTYSNFIYNSDSHRAVEMFTSKLEYSLTINNTNSNEFMIKPGNNMLHITIKSLNNIDSYYKLVYKNDNINVSYYENNNTNILKTNESVKYDIVVYNKTNTNKTIYFDVLGGFTTNKYEDIKVLNNYKEITNNINIGNNITINNESYKLLNIMDDGSYELLSDFRPEKHLNGSDGYNHAITTLNNLNAPLNSLIYRSLNLSDLRKYTKGDLVENDLSSYYSEVYYPALWEKEDSIINNIKNDKPLSREEEATTLYNTKYASSITIKGIKTNNIEFKKDIYSQLFLNNNYLLATRYTNVYEECAKWGILAINNNIVEFKELYDSNNNEYEIDGNILIYVVMSNQLDLFNTSI